MTWDDAPNVLLSGGGGVVTISKNVYILQFIFIYVKK